MDVVAHVSFGVPRVWVRKIVLVAGEELMGRFDSGSRVGYHGVRIGNQPFLVR